MGFPAEDVVTAERHALCSSTGAGRRICQLRRAVVKVVTELLSWSAVLCIACAVLFLPRVRLAYLDRFDADRIQNELQRHENFLRGAYQIEIRFDTDDPSSQVRDIAGDELSPAYRLAALHWLERELNKYPMEFLQSCRLRQITLVKHLNHDGESVGGLATGLGTIYVSVGGSSKNWFHFGGWLDSRCFASTFHHEIFHVADYRDYCDDDRDWIAPNQCGSGDYRGAGWRELDERPAGFANAYGTKDADEDQATVAQALMCEHDSIEGLSESDEVLAAKIAKCKAYFLRWSKGRMSDQFWSDLAGGRVGERYWQHPTYGT